MNDLLSECLGDPAFATSGVFEDTPENTSVVAVSVNDLSGLKNPNISHSKPPPQAENVPQRIHVRTEAADGYKLRGITTRMESN